MEIGSWLSRVKQGWQEFPADEEGRRGAGWGWSEIRPSWWQGLAGRSLEMAEVAEEVAAEQRGHLVMIGRSDEMNRWLLARLRQQPPVPAGGEICREGFFTLVHLPPSDEPVDQGLSACGGDGMDWDGAVYAWRADNLLDLAAGADLLLYLLSGAHGWQNDDARWYARLRATGVPLLPVVVCEPSPGQPPADVSGLVEALRRPLGVRPAVVWVSAGDQDGKADSPLPDLLNLVERILALRPRLAIPLAQEVPCCRQVIARRVIRSGALMTMLVGAEPVPLLDLPLHVALHWKVALQLAAIYGRPGLDYRSREMVGTVALNLCTRYAAQQALKLVPLIGWLLSSCLSGLSTWMLGNALLRYYQSDRLVDLKLLPPGWSDQLKAHLPAIPRISRQNPPAD